MQRGSQGLARVASEMSGFFSSCEGPIGFPLESLPTNRAVSRLQSGNSVFLSGGDSGLGLIIKVQQENQASPGVEAWDSAFLLSCQGVSGLWSSSGGEFGLFQEDRQGRKSSHPVMRGYSLFHWSQCRGIRTYLELSGNSASFFLVAGSTRFHSRFNW